jgi:nitroreductase
MKRREIMDYYQLTIDRKSTRAFKEKDIPQEQLNELKSYFNECKRLLPEINTELRIIDPDNSPMMHGCIGYDDYLIDAPAYLLILSAPDENYLLNAGFIGEDLVLKATDMGINSCWVTINEPERLAERLKLEGVVPAGLIAIGYEKADADKLGRLDIKNMSNVELKQRTGYVAPKLYK